MISSKKQANLAPTKSTISVEKKIYIKMDPILKKEDALDVLSKNPHLSLFSEEYGYKGSPNTYQQFFVTDIDTIYKFSLTKKSQFYEYRFTDQKIKLHLDIDVKIDTK